MGLAALQPHPKRIHRAVAANAPAKINLVLDVLERRPDGFHEIRSVVVGVGLYDRIECTRSNAIGLEFSCSDPSLRLEHNLASRAALLLARVTSQAPQLRINLEKRIPIGAGLGGGSSDAATTLRLCNELWGARCSDSELAHIGAELGSDVSLFFCLPSAQMTGRGELVSPCSLRWSGFALLLYPDIHVSTADVYRAWRHEDRPKLMDAAFDEICRVSRADEIHDLIHNHLETALYRVCPRVKEVQDAVTSLGIPNTRVTGSGSTLFRLYDDEDRARRAARTIQQSISNMRIEVVAAPVDAPPLEHKES